MTTRMRKFVPSREYIGNTFVRTQVKEYTWTRARGLRVKFNDGTEWASEYTLPELLKSGEAREVTPCE